MRIYFYKKYKGRNLKISRVTDKHCGKKGYKKIARMKTIKLKPSVKMFATVSLIFLSGINNKVVPIEKEKKFSMVVSKCKT